MNSMSPVIAIIGIILSVAATVFLSILFLGAKKREKWENNKICLFVYDVINFKTLLIDKIMKVLYIFCNCFCLIGGVIMFFYGIYSGIAGYGWSTFGASFAMIILGPIMLRILFELIMLVITLVQNVVEINKKMDDLKK